MAQNTILSAVTNIFDDFRAARRAESMFYELSSLSDDTLNKRGLRREDIAAYAFKNSRDI